MSDLFSVRDVIWQNASESEQEALRKKWQAERQPGDNPMSTTQSSNILTRLVAEQVSVIELAEAKAESAKREQELQLIAQKDQALRKSFSKLIEADVAHVKGGYLYFDYQDRKFRIHRDADQWKLEGREINVPIEGEHADVLLKLAATLARCLKKVSA